MPGQTWFATDKTQVVNTDQTQVSSWITSWWWEIGLLLLLLLLAGRRSFHKSDFAVFAEPPSTFLHGGKARVSPIAAEML
ncbi:hypothetical protein N7540_009977 [Penicillium herquei]|nr:hypothetical protein N7540_009977 [Penicillium herquei]